MNKKLVVTIIVLFLTIIACLVYFNKSNNSPKESPSVTDPANQSLKITSTNPASLDGATISPTQAIDITFNKPLSISGFKYKLDPEIEHEVVALGENGNFGQTFRITFKKPLSIGAILALTINSDTKISDREKLDKEYIYHIRTISYKGV